MSAMHWEARRRQSTLDRRTARDKPQPVLGGTDTICDTTEPKTAQEQTAGNLCPRCKADARPSAGHSGKIPNRYSSLQYTQQW